MVTQATNIKIVEAREEHIPFVAWVELTAARSHLPRGTWELYIGSGAETQRYLETLCNTNKWHFGSYKNFIIAEVDGKPAAGLSGYFDEECGGAAIMEAIAEANSALGRSEEEHAAGWERCRSILNMTPQHVARTWIIEWVATAPEFRRRGLVDRLMAEILDIGRSKGATTSDIGVLIGNDPAQGAYEKNGFSVVQEQQDAEFESVYGCPGMRLLRREL
jgi:ribosomal protein S18 acetylase RimI-like enzyme